MPTTNFLRLTLGNTVLDSIFKNEMSSYFKNFEYISNLVPMRISVWSKPQHFELIHIMPAFVSSCSKDLIQACLGRPRPLLPCGFESSAILDILVF